MATLSSSLRHLRCQRQWMGVNWQQINALARPGPTIHARANHSSTQMTMAEAESLADSVRIPFKDVKFARSVPDTPSYFSREPRFNDLYVQIMNLYARHRYLPIVKPQGAPSTLWLRLEGMRTELQEPIKASQYAKVMRIVKRLNLIVPDLMPDEVRAALKPFTRGVDSLMNRPTPLQIDRYGRAVGSGRRKNSSARAFVVEGTGEVLVNGKPLDRAFGRVFDRESVVWALTSTQRLEKYNVWALVQGGGTTGQSQALAIAIAKGLLAHEPALKTALRKAGCITRDARMVERKKHGHLKARKMPAWVKR